MIRLSLQELIFLYLALILGTIFGAWLLSEWRRQRRERQAFRHVLRCRICACEFEDTTSTPLPRCPSCGSLNERHRLSKL